jgi:hypothetical protein
VASDANLSRPTCLAPAPTLFGVTRWMSHFAAYNLLNEPFTAG